MLIGVIKFILFLIKSYLIEMTIACFYLGWNIVPQGVLKNSEIPAWTHDSVPGFTTHIWAPDVIRFKNKWYLAYSCSTFGKNTSAIGLLSNTSLSDKDGWKDEGCLVASKGDRDNWNAIDPNFIVDEKGNPCRLHA